MKLIDLTGRQFERLTVVSLVRRIHTDNGLRTQNYALWLCRCECGNKVEVLGSNLRQKTTRSCGCLQRERARMTQLKHGMHGSAEYLAWSSMVNRCRNPRNHAFPRYGGRGITVCERWLSFEHFFADMGTRPTPAHSIERMDNACGYSPENCRWATRREQCNNTRANRRITVAGQTWTIAQWAAIIGVKRQTLYKRVEAGWPAERVLKEFVGGEA